MFYLNSSPLIQHAVQTAEGAGETSCRLTPLLSVCVSGVPSQNTAVPVTNVLPTSIITVGGSTTVWGAETTSEAASLLLLLF